MLTGTGEQTSAVRWPRIGIALYCPSCMAHAKLPFEAHRRGAVVTRFDQTMSTGTASAAHPHHTFNISRPFRAHSAGTLTASCPYCEPSGLPPTALICGFTTCRSIAPSFRP